jgi:hypothetical protein
MTLKLLDMSESLLIRGSLLFMTIHFLYTMLSNIFDTKNIVIVPRNFFYCTYIQGFEQITAATREVSSSIYKVHPH